MERTMRKVVEELLSKNEALRREREELIEWCQSNCKHCLRKDCPHRLFVKATPPVTLRIVGQREC
jgi:hypothetical protein